MEKNIYFSGQNLQTEEFWQVSKVAILTVYTFDKQNMATIINSWNIKTQEKKLQLLTLYHNKEGKAKNN